MSTRLCALAVMFALTVGCKNGTLPAAPIVGETSAAALWSLKITSASHSVALGSTLALAVQGFTDQDAPTAVPSATWKTSDTLVASVSSKGVVKALKAGKVTITVDTLNPPREANISLTVLAAGQSPPPETLADLPDVTSTPIAQAGTYVPPDGSGDLPLGGDGTVPSGLTLAIYPTSPRVSIGQRLRLVATDGLGAPASAAWRSSNPAVASVDEAGNVTGLAAGSVSITAASLAYPALTQATSLQVVGKVAPSQIQGIRLTPAKVTMNVGETFWLQADVPTTTGTFDPNVRWEIGNSAVATVSETGQLTAVGPGSTVVTAIATNYDQGDLSASVPVIVRNAGATH